VLVAFIRKQHRIGTCDFCGSLQTSVVGTEQLHVIFKPLVDQFEPVDFNSPQISIASPLATALEWPPWKIFSGALGWRSKARLVGAILSLPTTRCASKWAPRMGSILLKANRAIWWIFTERIKRERRFLLGKSFDNDPKTWLPEFLPTIAFEIPRTRRFYRARVMDPAPNHSVGIAALPPEELGAPPSDKITRGGRANPPGIAYLYTAEDKATAVGEVKPHLGAFVSRAAFVPEKKLRIADLTRVEQVQSPFGHDDIAKEIMRCDLLRCLNEELSEPIHPERDAIDYVPCQYVVEVIRDSGFDGVRYRSAMRKGGFNMVFFRPEDLKITGKISLLRVRKLEMMYETSKPTPELSI
jgi:hypothetical protein